MRFLLALYAGPDQVMTVQMTFEDVLEEGESVIGVSKPRPAQV